FDLWESNARPSRYRCSSTHASGSALLVNFEELGFHLSEETGRSSPLRRPNTPAAPFLGRGRRQPPAPEIVVADNEPRSGLGTHFRRSSPRACSGSISACRTASATTAAASVVRWVLRAAVISQS